MCDSRDDALVALLEEIVEHVYRMDGDEKKAPLLAKWRDFLDQTQRGKDDGR